ncbi:MAG: isopentenyl phosphate kinase [Halobellus sp.]|uniref:isopentenyl phosphate kinase n=1 Tax=Halobellus sp. TaxID=1979212 RepID=UPI0035D51495
MRPNRRQPDVTVVLKLGGSVVTDKETPETVDDQSLAEAVETIGEATPERLVLVHGGGSFGHYQADKHGVSLSTGSHDAQGVWAIHDAMRRLNDVIVGQLQDAGVSALPVHPLSVAARDANADLTLPRESIRMMLAEGFVPVLHGDVVAQADAGATIISGDELVTRLATGLSADRVGLCSTVPGVYDDDGAVIPRISEFAQVDAVLGESETTDVTGGMAEKVRALLELDTPAHIFGPESLPVFLAGESAGTVVDSRSR